jgi:hypothetical protein
VNDVSGEFVTIGACRIFRARGAICHVMNPD